MIVPKSPSPPRDRLLLVLADVETPRYARVLAWREVDGDGWQDVDERVSYYCDSTLTLHVGDRIMAQTKVRDYANRGSLYLRGRDVVDQRGVQSPPLCSRLNNFANGRIKSLGLSPRGEATVEAMVIGRRDGLERAERDGYRRSGAAHILAISGLHVGVVAMLFMALTAPLGLLFRGYILRHLLVVVMVWLFASLNFFTPSVLRATMMISAALLIPLLSRGYHTPSVVLLTAGVMLLFDWGLIYDVGFQLSFICVVAILLWALPIWRARPRVLRNTLSTVVVLPMLFGAVCSVATLPIVVYNFGYLSLWGVLINPLLLITAEVIVSVTMVWILFGFAPLAILFRPVLELAVEIQSGAVAWVASLSEGGGEIAIPSIVVFVIYLLYGVATFALRRALKI